MTRAVPPSSSPAPSLLLPEAYALALEKLRAKAKARPGGRRPSSEGVSLPQLSGAEPELCELVASDVATGRYRFAPLARSVLVVEGKRRVIFRPDLLDALVLGALSARLTGLLEAVLADSVHAYRPGRSAMLSVARLRERLAAHRSQHSKQQRGLFVLQRDLSNYGESIPTHERSALWQAIDDVLSRLDDVREARVARELLAQACRPRVVSPDGSAETMTHGLPTGSPIQQPLANLYLTALDASMAEHEVYYARFGDDLLVVSEAQQRANAASRDIETVIDQLELRLNTEKTKNWYFTKPGRPLTQSSGLQMAPTSHIEYLGVRLNFDGRMGLKSKRVRQLLLRSRWRIENALRLAPAGEGVPLVARCLEQALTDQDGLGDPLVAALASWVDDREQLRQLDHRLAQSCAEAVSGKRGVRAFRQIPPSALRDAGLSSLLQLRRRVRG